MAEQGLHWETLQKILSHSQPPGYRSARKRKSKIGNHLEWIGRVLDTDCKVSLKQRHSAKRIFDQLRIECGCDSGYTAVKYNG